MYQGIVNVIGKGCNGCRLISSGLGSYYIANYVSK